MDNYVICLSDIESKMWKLHIGFLAKHARIRSFQSSFAMYICTHENLVNKRFDYVPSPYTSISIRGKTAYSDRIKDEGSILDSPQQL